MFRLQPTESIMRIALTSSLAALTALVLFATNNGCSVDDCEAKRTCSDSGAVGGASNVGGSGGATAASGGAGGGPGSGSGGMGGQPDTCGNGVVDVGEVCFTEPSESFLTGVAHEAIDLAIVDCNDDGAKDVVVLGKDPQVVGGSVSALVNDGQGSFGGAIPKSFTYATPSRMVTGRLFGNADSLVMGMSDNQWVDLWLRTGCNYEYEKTWYPMGTDATIDIAVADLNGDGDDGFVALQAAPTASDYLVSVDGAIDDLVTELNAGTSTAVLAVGKLNGDTDDDVVTVTEDAVVRVRLTSGGSPPAASTNFNMGDNPGDVGVGDVNGDGNADIVVSNTQQGSASVAFGDGAGVFAVQLPATDSPSPSLCSLDVGDINGDGIDDVVAIGCTGGNTLELFLGGSSLTHQRTLDLPTGATAVRIVDLNGDSLADLVVSIRTVTNSSATVRVFLQKP